MDHKKKSVLDMDPKETRQVMEVERKRYNMEQKMAEYSKDDPNSPYIDDRNLGDDSERTKDLKDAWKQLIKLAEVRFPKVHAAKFQLMPRQRLVAIAKVQGWTVEEICKASGFSKTTVYNYLKDPLVQEFQQAFEYFIGQRDGRALIESEIYPSIQTLKDLRDDPKTPASVRQSISTWFWEAKYGKSKEVKEVRGDNIRELTKQLMQKSQIPTQKEEDEEEYIN